MTLDKMLNLRNIRQQYKQDCVIVYKNHVYTANPITILALQLMKEAFDKDGYPVPLSTDDAEFLLDQLSTASRKAKKNYFERLANLGLDKLTEVKPDVEEAVE